MLKCTLTEMWNASSSSLERGIKLSQGASDAENVGGDDEEGDGRPDFETVAGGEESLDKVLETSGFTRKDQETLEQFIENAEDDDELSEEKLSEEEDDSHTENSDNVSDTLLSFQKLIIDDSLDEGLEPTRDSQSSPVLDEENSTASKPEDGDESESGEDEDPKLQKRLEKTRNRAASHVKTASEEAMEIGEKYYLATPWTVEGENLVRDFCNSGHLSLAYIQDYLRARLGALPLDEEERRLAHSAARTLKRYLRNSLPKKIFCCCRCQSSRYKFEGAFHD